MDFLKALQTAGILIDVIKALHGALTENTESNKVVHASNLALLDATNKQTESFETAATALINYSPNKVA